MEENTINTFGIKMSILNVMGSASNADEAEKIFQWVMQELEIVEPNEATVTTLHTVQ